MLFFVLLAFVCSACTFSQNPELSSSKLVGGPCEGCEGVFEFDDTKLTSVDTLPDFGDVGPKLKISGTIYQSDGRTPAKNVILYLYHTDQKGIYAKKGNETGWAKSHGYIRGWIKTDHQGSYTFYTLKPASYPDRSISAHIHPTVLEPNGKYYWLTDYYFRDDPFLTSQERTPKNPRGGTSGVLDLTRTGDLWIGTRDFILGKNILDYK